jgi:hypothetical protein
MRWLPFLAVLCVLGACGAGAPKMLPSYMNSDVLEPPDMTNPVAEGVKLQGPLFQEGSLIYEGDGTIDEVFTIYIQMMQKVGWNASSTEQEPDKRMSATMTKDFRVLSLDVTPGEDEDVRVEIRVTRGGE